MESSVNIMCRYYSVDRRRAFVCSHYSAANLDGSRHIQVRYTVLRANLDGSRHIQVRYTVLRL